MTDKRIVYTRPDGGVNICCPSMEAISAFSNGGGFPGIALNTLNRHIDEEIMAGRNARLAMRYVHGLAFGGHTEAEAFEIIRDRDCAPFGTGFEVWDLDDIPRDRWFRDAWRRSHNGGPIYVAMDVARKIQMKRLQSITNQRHATLQENRWRERIRRAETPEELKTIWPSSKQFRM